MTMQEATFYLLNKLKTIYSPGEASEITDWVLENITGSKKAERMVYKNESITDTEEEQLKNYAERLMKYEPAQYVVGHSWFQGKKFQVDKNVLIPRPETEELVEWILEDSKKMQPPYERNFKYLDIGTGSGCIAISLKLKLPVEFEMWACDISDSALTVARKNADDLGVLVDFVALDFLDEKQRKQLPHFDCIVSNPPYIPLREKENIHRNVLDHEPHEALFVPDDDPLIFYKEIAKFAKDHLKTPGMIYCETQDFSGERVAKLFQAYGFETELKKDMQGKERMVKATSSLRE